jgi:hypothetical protein
VAEPWTDERLERLLGAIEINTQVLAQLAQGQKALTNIIDNLSTAQISLADSQSSLTKVLEILEARLTSTVAAVERLDTIVNHLLKDRTDRSP